MAVRTILQYEAAVLRQTARPVLSMDPNLHRLLDDMAETMYKAKGVGLAATQIGILRRVIVADAGSGLIELINPEWVLLEGEVLESEGCLSIAEKRGMVRRAQHVVVDGFNRHGERIQIDAVDLLARCLQHEVDHLNGILFIDREVAPVPVGATEGSEGQRSEGVD